MDIMQTTGWLLLMGVGKWLSHPVYGYVAEAVGRRSVYIVYVVMAGLLVPLFVWLESPVMILLVGMLVGFFGSGHFTGFATIANEMFPTEIRATAVGLTYNFGRGFSALAVVPFGAYRAWRILAGSLLFGFASALQFRLQAAGVAVPYNLLLMIPYALTLVVLAVASGHTAAPGDLARPFRARDS